MAINTQANNDSSQLQASQTGNIDVQGLNTSISSNDNSQINNNVINSQDYTLPSAIEEVDLSEYTEPLVGDPRWMHHPPLVDESNGTDESSQSQIEVGDELPEQVENSEELEPQVSELVDDQVEIVKPGDELSEQVENSEELEPQVSELVDDQVEIIKPGDELQNNDENPTDVETVVPQDNQVSESQFAATNNTSYPNRKPNPKPVDDIPSKSNSIYHGDNLKSYGSKSSSSYGSKSSSSSSNDINKIRPTVDRNADPFKNTSNYGSSQSRRNNYGSSYVGQNNYGSNGYIYHGPNSYGSGNVSGTPNYSTSQSSGNNYGSSYVGQNSYGSNGYIYHGPSSYGSSSINPSSSYGSTQSSTSSYGSSYVGQNSYGSNGYIYHGPSSYGSGNVSGTPNYSTSQSSGNNYGSANSYGSNGYIYHGNDLKGYGSSSGIINYKPGTINVPSPNNKIAKNLVNKEKISKEEKYQLEKNKAEAKVTEKSISLTPDYQEANNSVYSGEVTANGRKYKLYEQTEESWRYNAYGDSTIGGYGCGPTGVSTILSGFGVDKTPPEIVSQCYNFTSATGKGSAEALSLYYAANGVNVEAHQYAYNHDSVSCRNIYDVLNNDSEQIMKHLEEGNPVQLIIESPVGSGFHWVSLLGTDGNGNVMVSDPNNQNYWDGNLLKNDGFVNFDELTSTYCPTGYILVNTDEKKVITDYYNLESDGTLRNYQTEQMTIQSNVLSDDSVELNWSSNYIEK